ncbi:MAG: hypothetical protein LBH05_07750 [Deferribacteraceae bacterium]|jgi:predicted LPLAT superfamily acyltransferase|nr:hypothetical protein [Deferribacteraceae bacterium]
MNNWYDNKELSAGYLRLRLLLIIYRLAGAIALKIIVIPVTLITFLTANTQRKASYNFFAKLYRFTNDKKYKPGLLKSFRHFLTFSFSLIDRFQSWDGKLKLNDINIADAELHNNILSDLKQKRGCFILSSHFGNIEMIRGVVPGNIIVNAFIDIEHTQKFNQFIAYINPASKLNVYSVTKDMGIHTAAVMQDKIESGEVVVMMADRMPSTNARAICVNFLGEKISLPLGAFKLATLTASDIYTYFIYKNNKKYCMYIYKYSSDLDIEGIANKYIKKIETLILTYPYQWFNFY